jgi:hypothetical protein
MCKISFCPFPFVHLLHMCLLESPAIPYRCISSHISHTRHKLTQPPQTLAKRASSPRPKSFTATPRSAPTPRAKAYCAASRLSLARANNGAMRSSMRIPYVLPYTSLVQLFNIHKGTPNAIHPLPRIRQPPRPHPATKQQHSAARPQQGQERARPVPRHHDVLQSRSRGGMACKRWQGQARGCRGQRGGESRASEVRGRGRGGSGDEC